MNINSSDLEKLHNLGIRPYLNNVEIVSNTRLSRSGVFELRTDKGVKFLRSAGFYFAGMFTSFDLSYDNKIQKIDLTLGKPRSINEIYYLKVEKEKGVLVSVSYVTSMLSKNIELYSNDVKLEGDNLLKVGDVLEFRGLEGYVFSKVGGCFIGGIFKELELSEDKKVNKLNIVDSMFNGYNDFKLEIGTIQYLDLEQLEVVSIGSGKNRIHIIDEEGYNNLSTEIYNKYVPKMDGNKGYVNFDYKDFIINVLQLPFKLKDEFLSSGEEFVQVGRRVLDVSSKVLKSDKITYDLGTIRIVKENLNPLEIQNNECRLNLPFLDPVDIKLEYVLNQDLDIEMFVDVYSGKATYRVVSAKNGKCIFADEKKLGFSLPLPSLSNVNFGEVVYKGSISQGDYNGNYRAYIEILNSNSDLNNKFFSNYIEDEGELVGKVGFVTVKEIDIDKKFNSKVEGRIRDILSKGVILKAV